MSKILLNTAYFPPVQYLSKIKATDTVCIEAYEHYGKQSYRNRCQIMSANGVISLSVPVVQATYKKVLTRDVRIDYATPWQKLHFRTIESAYKNSPFYDYYIDDFMPCFEQKEEFLLDLNTRILNTLMPLLEWERGVLFTDDYIRETEEMIDLRELIHPKESRRKEDPDFVARPYHQTFGERYPFAPNLSILDLLFNVGPDANSYLTTAALNR